MIKMFLNIFGQTFNPILGRLWNYLTKTPKILQELLSNSEELPNPTPTKLLKNSKRFQKFQKIPKKFKRFQKNQKDKIPKDSKDSNIKSKDS